MNYKHQDIGQLGNSCMRYESCQDFFGIYTENKNVCQLLILLDGDKLVGRALVWKLLKSPCDAKYFMDRVYASSDSDIIKFNNYCDKEGWTRKYKNNCDTNDSYFFIYKGEVFFGEVSVKLEKSKFDKYPFFDTISNLCIKNDTISNFGMIEGSELKLEFMCSTDGYISQCEFCDGSGHVSDYECHECEASGSHTCFNCGGYGCNKCDNDGVVGCKECDGDGYITGVCPNCSAEKDIKDIIQDYPDKLAKLAKAYWNSMKEKSPKKKKEKEKKKKK